LTTTKNINKSSNVDTFAINKALSDYEGQAKLNIVHPGAGVNSLVEIKDDLASEKEQVELTTLDIFTKKENISYIDLLKIDAEGHDPVVIKGAHDLISKQNIGIIQFEYNWRWIYGNHFLYDIFKSLTNNNYYIGKVTPSGIQFYKEYNVELENFTEGNYIACLHQYIDKFKKVECWLDNK
jgi:FkbM family methyltransferase